MDIRGLVLVNSANSVEDQTPLTDLPLALLDVAGKNALERMADRLRSYGISPVTAVIDDSVTTELRGRVDGTPSVSISAPPERFWRAAENAFNDMAQGGAELVVVVRLGSYAEVDFERLVQFHLDNHCRVSQVSNEDERLEIFCVSASRRNDAASLFRSALTKCRSDCPTYEHVGYVNLLTEPWDLRQFAIDILTLKLDTCPAGEEIRPGVWVAKGAVIEKGARVVAPAFIGPLARVRSGAVITRCSAVESHAEIDCGTIVENSSVVQYSYVGAGLDLTHSVVGRGCIANLKRGVTVEIADAKLVAYLAASSGQKLLASAAELLTYLPRQMWHGIWGKYGAGRQQDVQTAIQQTSPALGKAAGYQTPACDTDAAREFSTNLVVARRYGNE